jgi:membrane fusion protein
MFRTEAIDAKKSRLTGSVVIAQPPSIYITSLVFFTLLLLTIVYLTQSHYSRKESVKGYLLPKKGVVKVYAGREGVLKDLFVTEGDRVKRGQVIARVRNSQSMNSGIDLTHALIKEIETQISELKKKNSVEQVIFKNRETRLKNQLVQLSKSLEATRKSKETTLKRLEIKKDQLERNRKLFEDGFLSSSQFSSFYDEYLLTLESKNNLEKELASIEVEISKLESEKSEIPESWLLSQATTQREISELKAKLAQQDNQFEFVKTAPESGIVTSIHPSLGAQVNKDTPILSIIPENSPLEIELLLPTRSAGFVKLGDKVNIRFDAFPYQKFGIASGEVINIDQAVMLPNESALPIEVEESVYRVRASLKKQKIYAYGQSFPLKVGMTADADIILERRSLLEWLLDPIYAIRGKIG